VLPGDQGRPLTDLSSRLVYPNLERDIRAVFGGEVIERAVTLSDGSEHYLARLLPYRTVNDTIDGVLLTFVDVTSVIAAEEQQKVLAAELSHRVKNTLAVVSSIAERTLPDGEAKTDLVGRFHSLGHTHDLLSNAGWTEAPLREIIATELAPYGAHITASGPRVSLKPQAALLFALVIHELATNAAKYGSLSTANGRVKIAWKIASDGHSGLEFTWTERGGPRINGFPTRGFGTELIERGIRFELQGEATLGAVDGGLQCRIVIPGNPQYLTFGSPSDRPITEEAAS
jgi:two-component system CheB/CheR fusion protein